MKVSNLEISDSLKKSNFAPTKLNYRKHNNKRAIADRGWFPLSKALLLHPLIMSSMTEIMIREENERKILPSTVLNDLNSKVYSDCNGVVTFGVNDITSNYRFNFLEVL